MNTVSIGCAFVSYQLRLVMLKLLKSFNHCTPLLEILLRPNLTTLFVEEVKCTYRKKT